MNERELDGRFFFLLIQSLSAFCSWLRMVVEVCLVDVCLAIHKPVEHS